MLLIGMPLNDTAASIWGQLWPMLTMLMVWLMLSIGQSKLRFQTILTELAVGSVATMLLVLATNGSYVSGMWRRTSVNRGII